MTKRGWQRHTNHILLGHYEMVGGGVEGTIPAHQGGFGDTNGVGGERKHLSQGIPLKR